MNNSLYIPKYFTLPELCITNVSSKNVPQFGDVYNLSRLCELILDPLRELLHKPVHINSAYRTSVVNAAVGGVPNSHHKYGLAADIVVASLPPNDLAYIIRSNFSHLVDELLVYKTFVHVSLKKSLL